MLARDTCPQPGGHVGNPSEPGRPAAVDGPPAMQLWLDVAMGISVQGPPLRSASSATRRILTPGSFSKCIDQLTDGVFQETHLNSENLRWSKNRDLGGEGETQHKLPRHPHFPMARLPKAPGRELFKAPHRLSSPAPVFPAPAVRAAAGLGETWAYSVLAVCPPQPLAAVRAGPCIPSVLSLQRKQVWKLQQWPPERLWAPEPWGWGGCGGNRPCPRACAHRGPTALLVCPEGRAVSRPGSKRQGRALSPAGAR